VGASQRLRVFTPVKVGVSLCAELLRLSRMKGKNDRIDEGTSPLYTLRERHVAHRGVLPIGYPIVEGMLRREPPFLHPGEVNVSYSHSMGPTWGYLTVVDSC